jgi:hypothetical protein
MTRPEKRFFSGPPSGVNVPEGAARIGEAVTTSGAFGGTGQRQHVERGHVGGQAAYIARWSRR